MASKGKGKEKEPAATTTPAAAAGGASSGGGPRMHTAGDWTAVFSAERNAYYFWNKKTNVTTWDNPLVGANASASASAGTTSNTSKSDNDEGSKDQQGEEEDEGPGNNDGADPAVKKAAVKAPAVASAASSSSKPDPSAADYGGIDPELAYLDPTLSTGRKGQSASGSYAARFNARTGRFEGDPTKNPDRVGDVERAKRQNQFYFDYDSWQKTLAVEQDQQAQKRAAAGDEYDDESNKRRKPSKKEMAAIRAKNQEKKEKKKKGWLLES